MAAVFQFRGGNAVESAAFVGAPREITVNTTTWQLSVHDGVTPGGHVFTGEVGATTGMEVVNSYSKTEIDNLLLNHYLKADVNAMIQALQVSNSGQVLCGAGDPPEGEYAEGQLYVKI